MLGFDKRAMHIPRCIDAAAERECRDTWETPRTPRPAGRRKETSSQFTMNIISEVPQRPWLSSRVHSNPGFAASVEALMLRRSRFTDYRPEREPYGSAATGDGPHYGGLPFRARHKCPC